MIGAPHCIPSGSAMLNATVYGATHSNEALLCFLPLAEERKGCLRPMASLCKSFARKRGTATLFDYRGTGDAPLLFEEITWETLKADAQAAFDAFLKTASPERIHLVAARLSARLALDVAASHPTRTASLCLWEPVWDGIAWHRELRRRSKFRQGGATLDPMDMDGYRFSTVFAESLPAATDASPAPPCPVAILSLSGRDAPTPSAAQTATNTGGEVHVIPMPPFWMETDPLDPSPIIDATLACLPKAS